MFRLLNIDTIAVQPILEDDPWLGEVTAVPRPARSRLQTLPATDQVVLTAALGRLGCAL